METQDYLKILEKETGIKFTACESSNIVGYGYDKPNKFLWVAFKGQKVYKYSGVTKAQKEDLDKAESKGRWVNANLVKPKVEFEAYVLD